MANDAATSLHSEYTIQLMKLPKKVRLMPEVASQLCCRSRPRNAAHRLQLLMGCRHCSDTPAGRMASALSSVL